LFGVYFCAEGKAKMMTNKYISPKKPIQTIQTISFEKIIHAFFHLLYLNLINYLTELFLFFAPK